MKQTTIFLLVVAVIAVAAFIIVFAQSPTINGNVVSTGEAQKVVIGARGGQFYPQTLTVKAGQPVELSLDSSVQGCLRDFTIRDFGIRKYLATPEDVLTFTPQEKGEYSFACSMGMAFGKLIVE
jgi:plastocyanin domain-containing protein